MIKKIVIVGAGFAGLNAAKKLAHQNVSITLIDRRNYHLFQPLLYQVAMAGLSPAEIATPIRSILSNYKNVNVVLGEVQSIDLKNKKVCGSFGLDYLNPVGPKKNSIQPKTSKDHTSYFEYDYLMVATGAEHSYFGNTEWEDNAPGLKTLEQATEIRRRVLSAFEMAEQEQNLALQKSLLTFIVVGGGPTGVELAGALGEISRFSLSKDFRNIDPRRARVILIEAGPRILPSFLAESSAHAVRDLEKLGVTVWTSTRVTSIKPEGVIINNELLLASTVIWAAGVKPSFLNQHLGSLDSQGRVLVEKDLSLKDHPEVFVAGDQIHFTYDGKTLPGQAPIAMQQGRHVAKNIKRLLNGKPTLPFQYFDKGQMATIGRSRAVVNIGQFNFYGFFAWLVWLFVHIYYLIGFKNRFFVLYQWVWSYFSFKKGARLIVNKEWRQEVQVDDPQKNT